jgi:hypothetical protein
VCVRQVDVEHVGIRFQPEYLLAGHEEVSPPEETIRKHVIVGHIIEVGWLGMHDRVPLEMFGAQLMAFS